MNHSLYDSPYWCPRELESCEPNRSSLVLNKTPSYVSLVSCTLSCLGSLLIVYSYWRWKDIRTGSRSIITFLAIADFFTAAGYIIAAGNYLTYFGEYEATPQCVVFQQICEMQSYITTWSSMSSFAWTSALAIYLYLTIVHGRILLANHLIPLFHVIAWVLPIVICLPLLLMGRLGSSTIAAANWCFIRGKHRSQDPVNFDHYIPLDIILLIFVAGKLWEIITYILVIVFYSLIKRHIHREAKLGANTHYLSTTVVAAVVHVDRRLTFIPMVFILLRMWGTMQLVYYLSIQSHVDEGCVPRGIWKGLFAFGILQAIGDGGQGWGNAILYIFTSPKIRERLFGWLYKPLIRCCLNLKSQSWHVNRHGERTHLMQGSREQAYDAPHDNRSINEEVSEESDVLFKNGTVRFIPRDNEYEPTTMVSD